MGNYQITKTKITYYNITQCVLDAITFDERYKGIRGSFEYRGFECFDCGKHFNDGDKISVIITDKGNKTVCHECGIKINKELEG